jgi:hypothetical protein
MVKTCLSPNIWDNWNKWEVGSNKIDFKVPKSKNKPDNPVGECSVPEPETEGTTGVGNGEAKLSMELKGVSEPLGGANDPTDITDLRPNGFGYISVKEFSSRSRDLRLGVHASTQYIHFLSGFVFGIRSWLFQCYYQSQGHYANIKHTRKFKDFAKEIRDSGDEEDIRQIHSLLYIPQGTKKVILTEAILSGELCNTKMDQYNNLIFAVQEYVNKHKERFIRARIYHNKRVDTDERTDTDERLNKLALDDYDSYYGLLPEDFIPPIPNFLYDSNFIQLLIAVEMFPSDIQNKISCLDKMAQSEALGGKELCDEVLKGSHASYKTDESKPVLIFVNESCGYFPVGNQTYNDIICERISQNKPKLGVKRDSRIRTTCEDFISKRKKSSSKSPMLATSNSPMLAASNSPSQPSQKKGKQNKSN